MRFVSYVISTIGLDRAGQALERPLQITLWLLSVLLWVALLLRLRGLYGQLREAMAELGTLHEYRWQMPRDATGHILLVPGAVEAFPRGACAVCTFLTGVRGAAGSDGASLPR